MCIRGSYNFIVFFVAKKKKKVIADFIQLLYIYDLMLMWYKHIFFLKKKIILI